LIDDDGMHELCQELKSISSLESLMIYFSQFNPNNSILSTQQDRFFNRSRFGELKSLFLPCNLPQKTSFLYPWVEVLCIILYNCKKVSKSNFWRISTNWRSFEKSFLLKKSQFGSVLVRENKNLYWLLKKSRKNNKQNLWLFEPRSEKSNFTTRIHF